MSLERAYMSHRSYVCIDSRLISRESSQDTIDEDEVNKESFFKYLKFKTV